MRGLLQQLAPVPVSAGSSSGSPSVTQLTDIKEPHPNDVVYGRGGMINQHIGNIAWRKKIEENKPNYVLLSTRKEKTELSRKIVDEIRSSQNPPGRFLKKDDKTGLYFDVGDYYARCKTSQALREKAKTTERKNNNSKQPQQQPKIEPKQPTKSKKGGGGGTTRKTKRQTLLATITNPASKVSVLEGFKRLVHNRNTKKNILKETADANKTKRMVLSVVDGELMITDSIHSWSDNESIISGLSSSTNYSKVAETMRRDNNNSHNHHQTTAVTLSSSKETANKCWETLLSKTPSAQQCRSSSLALPQSVESSSGGGMAGFATLSSFKSLGSTFSKRSAAERSFEASMLSSNQSSNEMMVMSGIISSSEPFSIPSTIKSAMSISEPFSFPSTIKSEDISIPQSLSLPDDSALSASAAQSGGGAPRSIISRTGSFSSLSVQSLKSAEISMTLESLSLHYARQVVS